MGQNGKFRVVYTIEGHDGGLNNKYEPNVISDIESPDCLNVVFDDRGGVQTRDGSRKLNTAAVGSFAGDGLFTYRREDGTEKMLGWWNGSMYELSGTSFITVPSAQSVFTAGTRVDMFVYQDLAFFGNGGSKPYKYNGTEFTRHGIPQPNSGPTVSSGTAGSYVPTGDVNYKISYVNSYVVEGDVSTFTTTLNIATSASVSLSSLPLAPTSFGVASRKIYRRDSTTAGSYKLVATVADNSTTSYLDQIPAASLGTTAPTDQGEPPNWKFGITHQERGWLVEPSNPSLGYYTEIGNPFVVKVTNYTKIGDGDGENITGIGIHSNSIVYYKDASAWVLYLAGTAAEDWSLIKTNSKYGAASHFAKADYSQLQMFIGKRYNVLAGFMALAGVDTAPDEVNLTVTGIRSESHSDRIEPEVYEFNTTHIPKACAIEYKNKLWFSVPTGASTVNNKVYQFDFQRRDKDRTAGSFVPFSYPHGFSAFTIYNGRLYAQSSSANGFVYQLDAGQYSDDGTAINSYFWTKEYQGFDDDIENQKDFRFANFIVETLGDYYMNITYLIDSDAGVGTTIQADLNPGSSLYGTAIYGVDVYGGGVNRDNVRISLSPSAGKKIQFKFDNQNTAGQAFHVLPRGTFSYNVRGLR